METSKIAFLAVAASIISAAPSFANDCDAVVAASMKQANTPYKADMTITAPDAAPAKGETIYTGTKLYSQVDGQWNTVPLTAGQIIPQVKANEVNMTCKNTGDDTVGGEAVSVYTATDTQQNATVTSRIWISKKSGLPVRNDAQIAQQGVTQTISMTFDYNNVQAPAGVQ